MHVHILRCPAILLGVYKYLKYSQISITNRLEIKNRFIQYCSITEIIHLIP